MDTLTTSREAKQFLIEKILEQAEHENAHLSETERKMLSFSSDDWEIPFRTETARIFAECYDISTYEQKIAHLIRNFRSRARKANCTEDARWKQAIRTIKKESHYVLHLNKIATVHPIRNAIWTFFLFVGTILFGAMAVGSIYACFIGDESWWLAALQFAWLSFLARLCFRLTRSRIKNGSLGPPPDPVRSFYVDF